MQAEPTSERLNGSAKLLDARPALEASARTRFQPERDPALEEDPDAPVYLIRNWTVGLEREFRRELRATSTNITAADLLTALRRATKEYVSEELRDEYLAKLDAWTRVPKIEHTDIPAIFLERPAAPDVPEGDAPETGDPPPPTEPAPETDEDRERKAKIAEVTELWGEIQALGLSMQIDSPGYRKLVGAALDYQDDVVELACKYTLVGWERVTDATGAPLKFERKGSLPTDATLHQITRAHRALIGRKALTLQRPSEAQRKN